MWPITVLNFFLSLLIFPVVYGRIKENITGESHLSFWQTFEKYRLNYYVVWFILIAPAFAFSFVFGNLFDWTTRTIIQFGITTVISVFTIYVLPLVFLIEKNTVTIPLGIRCLFNNFKYSLPLLMLVLFISVIRILFKIKIPLFLSNQPILLIPYVLVHNFLSLYISFIIFTMASMLLVKESDFERESLSNHWSQYSEL